MALKFETEPQIKLGTKVLGDSLYVVIQDKEDLTVQTIASVTDRGLILYPLAYSHKDTPQKLGFKEGAFDEGRTIKVLEEATFSEPRLSTDDSVQTTFRCRSGDGDFVRVSRAFSKGVAISTGDDTCVMLGVDEAIAFRDTIDHFIRKAKES